MCTALSMLQSRQYFGRTLDYEMSYNEKVTITPRNYPFHFSEEVNNHHYAIIGMTAGESNYPLYYDAVNEKGLCMAGLMFSGNAQYLPPQHNRKNVASFEFIPWILSRLETVEQTKSYLSNIRITNVPFSKELQPSPLHWIIADENGAIVVEPMEDGVKIYDNPLGVLTNNPTFPYHMLHLTDYLHLSAKQPQNSLYSNLPLQSYSRGMGAFGMPGDYSSASRFIRTAFGKGHITHGRNEQEEIIQFFRVLRTVEVPRGYVTLENGKQVFTVYTSCCDAKNGMYYFSTYENPSIHCVNLFQTDLDATALVQLPLPRECIAQALL